MRSVPEFFFFFFFFSPPAHIPARKDRVRRGPLPLAGAEHFLAVLAVLVDTAEGVVDRVALVFRRPPPATRRAATAATTTTTAGSRFFFFFFFFFPHRRQSPIHSTGGRKRKRKKNKKKVHRMEVFLFLVLCSG
jgi:hypothetical protein